MVGTLAPGKAADFVVLSDNPHEVEFEQIPRITARQTWFAGTGVFSVAAQIPSATAHA
ncbi:MAG: Amidohydrolase 3 [Citricoccus sp.]|nr:Amidohydrolase 3 [Citricoccus sp. WCRC_4]